MFTSKKNVTFTAFIILECMDYGSENFWRNNEVLSTVRRYEEMLRNSTRCFFDVHEFEDIIDYYLDSNNITEAAAAANYATHIYPQALSIQMRIAEILIDKRQPVQALKLLNKLESLESDDYEIYLMRGAALNILGKPREAQRQFETAISLADENKAEVLYNIGMSFERINRHNVALKYFMKVHAMEPENYLLYYDLAYCYERLNDLDKSIACYEKYLNEDPFSEYIWYNLGIVYNRKDDCEKALEAYDYAIAVNPGYSSAYFNRANTLSLLERYSEAIETYRAFLEMEPDNAAAFCYMGECYEQLNEYSLAKTCHTKALSLDSQFADAWFGVGVVAAQNGQYKEAVKNFLHALHLDKDNTEYLFALASVYVNMKVYKKAVIIFNRLVQLLANEVEMWDCFAQIYARQEDFTNACRIILEALKFNAGSALLHYRLAAYYLLDDEQQSGLDALEKALKTYPEASDCFFDVFELDEESDAEIMTLMNKYGRPIQKKIK